MSRLAPILLTLLAIGCAVVGIAGLAGPWWACLAAALGLVLFVVVTDFETGAKP